VGWGGCCELNGRASGVPLRSSDCKCEKYFINYMLHVVLFQSVCVRLRSFISTSTLAAHKDAAVDLPSLRI
jgi:hypothetical protein